MDSLSYSTPLAVPRVLTWRRAAYAAAALLTVAVGHRLLLVPFNVDEIISDLLQIQSSPSAFRIMVATFTQAPAEAGFLRNFHYAISKVLFDASQGHYFITFRAFHIALVAVLLLLLVWFERVRSFRTFALALLSAVVLIGIHPFHQAVRETEINIKLLMSACVFVALALSVSKAARWKDVVAVLLAALCFFSNELGLLVWVVLAAAYLVGFRGVSRNAVLVVTGLLGLYFYLRFGPLHVGAPGLSERSSGWGFRSRDPGELVAMFGGNPYPFYAYNVVASFLTVMFSEPRSGTYLFIGSVVRHDVEAGLLLEVASSVAATAVMVRFTIKRFRQWLRLHLTYEDRLFLVSFGVIAANASISYPYAKEVVMTPGGAFYAVALFVAMEDLLADMDGRVWRVSRLAGTYALVAFIAVSWTIRGASFFVDMQRSAYRLQNDWVTAYEWMDLQRMPRPTPVQRQMLDGIRAEMLAMPIAAPYGEPWWLNWLDPLH